MAGGDKGDMEVCTCRPQWAALPPLLGSDTGSGLGLEARCNHGLAAPGPLAVPELAPPGIPSLQLLQTARETSPKRTSAAQDRAVTVGWKSALPFSLPFYKR